MRNAELGRMVHRQHLSYLPLLPKAMQPPRLHCHNAECRRDHVIMDTGMRVNKQHKSRPCPYPRPCPCPAKFALTAPARDCDRLEVLRPHPHPVPVQLGAA